MELIATQSGPEWEPHVPDSIQHCDCCEEIAVVETTELERFQYGDGDGAVLLEADVPVMSCRACGIQWTDHRGEELRDAAVKTHLATVANMEAEGSSSVNTTTLQKSAAVLANANKLWRDADARARFEIENGIEKIVAGNSFEVEAQHQSGRTAEYHAKFMAWAADQSR
ncbi:hypothetical protein G6L37_06085 [Agrobacterium rubi]|nr:hypothetical protein [Agrobacterium rubi]NTF24930.1 hypothetical protein [Agrobacterium rubi]